MLKLVGVHLEEGPGVVAGQFQPQQLVRAAALALALGEPPTVEVQPLEVQQPLAEVAVPRLVHPHHAVDALTQLEARTTPDRAFFTRAYPCSQPSPSCLRTTTANVPWIASTPPTAPDFFCCRC